MPNAPAIAPKTESKFPEFSNKISVRLGNPTTPTPAIFAADLSSDKEYPNFKEDFDKSGLFM